MTLPLLSIIVPIYNVEPYIKNCIDSIINQTYKNLEIILVDDGSPDNCGKICDDYALIDRRIIVIHKENGGLSSARNSGIDSCTGEYIGFIDSDDCIHPEMYERLFKDINMFQTKLAFCQSNMCKGEIIQPKLTQPTHCYDKTHVMYRSMKETIWWSACTKLYHRSLFNNIRFPLGKTNEDYPFMMRIYDLCNKISVNYNKMYNYCIRENSICTSSLNIRKFDQIDTTLEVLKYMDENHPEWRDLAENIFLTSIIKLLGDIYNDNSGRFEEQKVRIFNLIKEHKSSAMKNKHVLFQHKVMLYLAAINPTCFKLIHKFYKIKNG